MNEDFVSLLKASWIFYVENPEVPPVVHFAANLKHIKEVYITWSVKNKVQELKDLMDIEFQLAESFNKVGFGFSSEEDKASFIELESRKSKIPLDQENEARQKSRAIWLTCGDDNTYFFHKYPNHRKNINSIRKIANDDGNLV